MAPRGTLARASARRREGGGCCAAGCSSTDAIYTQIRLDYCVCGNGGRRPLFQCCSRRQLVREGPPRLSGNLKPITDAFAMFLDVWQPWRAMEGIQRVRLQLALHAAAVQQPWGVISTNRRTTSTPALAADALHTVGLAPPTRQPTHHLLAHPRDTTLPGPCCWHQQDTLLRPQTACPTAALVAPSGQPPLLPPCWSSSGEYLVALQSPRLPLAIFASTMDSQQNSNQLPVHSCQGPACFSCSCTH